MSRLAYLVALFLVMISGVSGQDFPERPNPPRLVNDLAGVLDNSTAQRIEEGLASFARQSSTQIAVVTISDIGGYDASSYAFQLAEKWGIGQQDKDNGILMLVQPKTSGQRGQAFIATGYGLEGVVPDAVANRIVDNEMIPRFKQNDYAGGIIAGINVLMEITRGEYTAEGYMERSGGGGGFGGLIILGVMALIFLSAFRGQKNRHSSVGHSLPFWMLLATMGGGSRRHTGSYGNFSSGSGSFGGGFGGFGGGSFGGGGAGGSW